MYTTICTTDSQDSNLTSRDKLSTKAASSQSSPQLTELSSLIGEHELLTNTKLKVANRT
jgi:hypothetical protein